MRKRFLTAAAAFGAVSSFAGAAGAADIIEQPPVYVAPPAPVSTAGWYLRGDVGYVFESESSGRWKFYNQFPGVEGVDDEYHYDNIRLDDTASFGVGVGYRFTDYFRVDATADYFRTSVSGNTECPYMIKIDAAHDLRQGEDCHYDDSSDADIWTVMANAYVDLGHYGRFTPYIGAGLGAAYVSYDTAKTKEVCDACADSYARFSGKHEGEDSWRFASSLMAGASFDITDHLKLDAGYRYTHINGGKAFQYDDADKDFGASGTQMHDNGFDIHTIRAGLRYEFGGGTGFGKGKEPVYSEFVPNEPAPVYK